MAASGILLWHRRLFGGFWALCGVACLVDLRRGYWWEHSWQVLLPLLIGLLFAFGGIRFILGQRWAGRIMLAMMFVAGLFFLDMMLLAGSASHRQLLRLTLLGLALSAYTVLVVVASAIRRSRAAP